MTSKMIPVLLLLLCLSVLFVRFLFAEWRYRNADKMQRYHDAPRVNYSQKHKQHGTTKKSTAARSKQAGR